MSKPEGFTWWRYISEEIAYKLWQVKHPVLALRTWRYQRKLNRELMVRWTAFCAKHGTTPEDLRRKARRSK